jgi:DNA-binding winged helix-turn-helix (wHTH) protein/Flp pilus assembly protein TadD
MRDPDSPAGADWALDRPSHEIVRAGRRVRLADKPYRVLVALLDRPGQVVTREELHRLLWADDTHVDFDNNLNSAVATLRLALGDQARSPRWIETLPRIGYRLIVPPAPAAGTRRSFGARRSRLALVAGAAALAVVGAVSWLAWSAGVRGTAAASISEDRLAQADFDRGRYLRGLHRTGQRAAAVLADARAAFRAAAARDPSFAAAVAEEADTLIEMAFAGVVPIRAALEEARALAGRAAARAPRNASARRVASLADLLLDWNVAAAVEGLAAADAWAPDDARTAIAQAMTLAAEGRYEEAVRAAERAVALDPEAYFVRADLAFFYLSAGRDEEAAASCRRVLAVAPDFLPAHAYLLMAAERMQRWPEAAEAAQALGRRLAAGDARPPFGAAGGPAEVVHAWHRWRVSEASREPQATAEAALDLALKQALAGDLADAQQSLERAHAGHASLIVLIRAFPELAPLRGDPRFERLANAIVWPGRGD